MIRNTIYSFNEGKCEKELLVLTGPRRVGKSTILFRILDEFKDSSCYINIEDSNVRNLFNTGYSLKDLVITLYKETKRNIFLLDEITKLKNEWADAVKELWDYMEKNSIKIFLIITGSVGILLSNNYSVIAGRSGYCKSGNHILTNPLIVLPKKFAEIIPYSFYRRGILPLKTDERIEYLIKLAQGDEKIIRKLNEVLRSFVLNSINYGTFSKILKDRLDHYMQFGGFPQILNIITSPSEDPLEDVSKIAQDILNSIHKDAPLIGDEYEKAHTEKFLEAYARTANMSAMVDITKLERELKIQLNLSENKTPKNLLTDLMSFFVDSHILVKANSYTKPTIVKLFLNDPALFWGLYYKKRIKKVTRVEQGLLLEHIVCSHISRLGQNFQLEFYNDGEKDIDCIFELKGNKLLVQVKMSDREINKDLTNASEVIESLRTEEQQQGQTMRENYYAIAAVHDADSIIKTQDGTIIPAALFLSLI
ncbi:MAG: AAA family ATPase [Thaumarchaeota archaeon]|nr:AAA family ATPase [Nitrososphaerota archaeon]